MIKYNSSWLFYFLKNFDFPLLPKEHHPNYWKFLQVYNIKICLKTDTILLQYTLHQFQYFIATCSWTVENYQQIFQTNSFNGNDLMAFFNWGWSGLISKLSLIRGLNLLATEGRIWKWSKSTEQLYSRKWSDTAYCVTLSKHIRYTLLLCSPSKKVVVCFTMISNFAVTTRVSVNNVRVDLFLKAIFMTEQRIQFAWWLGNNF